MQSFKLSSLSLCIKNGHSKKYTFRIVLGTCFCAGKGEGFNKQKVLYCFGEAVIERQNIRGDEDGESSVEEDEVFYLQLAQMMVILFSLLAV